MSRPGGHRPRKRFGQNFLHDAGIIDRIITAIAPRTDQHIVEIGPGQGALTAPLLDSGCRLTAIEIDRDLAGGLHRRFGKRPDFALIEADVLAVDLSALGDAPLRVVGNLPYNISTPLLFHVLACEAVADLHVMLQAEVVDRLVADAGDPAYGRLSVMRALHASADRLLTVPPGAFRPSPKVTSAVVRLRRRPAPFVCANPGYFDQVVRLAFSARRKTLTNALRELLTTDAIAACDVDPGARAGTVTPAAFARLADAAAAAGRA